MTKVAFFPKERKQPSQLDNEKSVVASCEEKEKKKRRARNKRRDLYGWFTLGVE